MRRITHLGIALIALFGSSCTRSPTPHQTEADVEAIQQLIANYARSVSAADTGLAAQVWDSAGDPTFIHPLGHEHGWPAIKKDVYEDLMAGMFSARDLQPEQPTIHVVGDSGWSEFDWVFHATLKDGNKAVVNRGRETQIYRRNNGRWQIEHVHYSAAPEK